MKMFSLMAGVFSLVSGLLFGGIAHASPLCPEGAWDLGPRIAALDFECHTDSETGVLRFCNREVLLKKGVCNHIGLPLNCRAEEGAWVCVDNGEGYRSETRWTGEEKILFKFKSSFSRGEWPGARFR